MKPAKAPGSQASQEADDAFLAEMEAIENAPYVVLFDVLVHTGVSLPAPDTLDDTALHAKLWEIIHVLAGVSYFIESTDHLSDRQLYERLWTKTLRDEAQLVPPGCNGAYHMPMTDDEEEEYLRFFADDETFERMCRDFPGLKQIKRERPCYDRDRLLPIPAYARELDRSAH